MTDGCGEFAGLMRFDAREAVCKRLAELGLSRGEADNKMRLGVCSRSGDIIEPLIKPQWYVSCRQMGADAAAAVREGRLRLVPDHHNATWYHWLDNSQVGGRGGRAGRGREGMTTRRWVWGESREGTGGGDTARSARCRTGASRGSSGGATACPPTSSSSRGSRAPTPRPAATGSSRGQRRRRARRLRRPLASLRRTLSWSRRGGRGEEEREERCE